MAGGNVAGCSRIPDPPPTHLPATGSQAAPVQQTPCLAAPAGFWIIDGIAVVYPGTPGPYVGEIAAFISASAVAAFCLVMAFACCWLP